MASLPYRKKTVRHFVSKARSAACVVSSSKMYRRFVVENLNGNVLWRTVVL